MAAERRSSSSSYPKTLVPWLVKRRDFQPYLGRALTACKKGRVIFVIYTAKKQKALFYGSG
jgi:hypothetical protein